MAVLLFSLSTTVALAEGSPRFSLEPMGKNTITDYRVASYEYKVAPGSVIVDQFAMRNIEDDVAVDLGVEVRLRKGSPDIAEWFEFPGVDFTVPPASTKSLQFKLTVPEDAEPGTYGGILNLLLAPDPDATTGNVAVAVASTQRVLVYVEEGEAGYFDYTDGTQPVEEVPMVDDKSDIGGTEDLEGSGLNKGLVGAGVLLLVLALALVMKRRDAAKK